MFDKLHERGYIDKHKPFWWDVDYAVDPREIVSPDEFLQRTNNYGSHLYLLL